MVRYCVTTFSLLDRLIVLSLQHPSVMVSSHGFIIIHQILIDASVVG